MNSPCQTRPASPEGEGSTRCDGCKSCGAILELDCCGHRFHPRCIFTWPISQCEICAAPVNTVKIFREYKNLKNSMVRKGKWSNDEHKYANMMMRQFQLGALPLVDGLHLRGFISSLLQCDPLRVTKKYSGHAIGKQNFFYQYRKTYCYNLHIKLQKRVSSLRNHFYWHIQYRCKFGHSLNIQELKAAESDYWIREFLKFADKIGQQVEFSTHPVPTSPAPAAHPVSQKSSNTSSAPSLAVASVENQEDDEVKVEASPEEPEEEVSIDVDATAPSSDKNASDEHERSVSPLSFDEWSDASPSFADVLTGMVFEDFSQGDATLSPILPSKVVAPRVGARCTLGDWLQEEEARWNETMAVPSWSFTLSDCA
uniref:RING-type domain-containing protein n=1 Tax=Globisporangium ultimum (strain ATCC 200006 / CBS 805.95 / DAOM BR144) TaxID=431595 RepID=K3XCD9_GLOUD